MDRRIVIEGGRVHGVGYRLFLFLKARMLRIERFVAENAYEGGREVVIVSFGGRDKAVNEFAEFCRSARPDQAQVSGVREEEHPEDILTIDEYDRILASEQQSRMVHTGLAMIKRQDITIALQEKTVGLQEKTLGLQEKTVEKLDEFHRDTIRRFDVVDEKYGKIAQNLERILEEMKEERLEARKSTERIIAMIAGMKTGGAIREKKAVYRASKSGKRKK
ncbi:MAG: acylphosphatase [Candidatus Altiarchaeota archaeon]|nr:acylphosphatase [Candidatus Altiarchaeota archaeon]